MRIGFGKPNGGCSVERGPLRRTRRLSIWRPCKAKKGVKGGDKFIEWSPSGIVQSLVPLLRQGRSDRTKKCKAWPVASAMRPKKTRMLRVPLATWTTTIDIAWHGMTKSLIAWSRLRQRQPRWVSSSALPLLMQVLTIRLAASINAFTMVSLPYWLSRPPTVTMTRVGDSKSVTAISEEEEISNSQGPQEGQLQSPDPSDGDPTGHSMDEAFWLKDADRTGDSTTEPVWLSLPITGAEFI